MRHLLLVGLFSLLSLPLRAETWTVFVYGHGDHNLSPSLVIDILEMSWARFGPEVQVVVAADFNASESASLDGVAGYLLGVEGPSYPNGTFLYRINGASSANPVQVLGISAEQNLDTLTTMRSVITTGLTTLPATDRYALVFWDHGGAWLGVGGDTQDGTIGGTGVTLPELATTIGQALGDAGIAKLDLLGIDACLMANAEVLAALTPLCHAFCACAELDYGPGWGYDRFLKALDSLNTETPVVVANAEVKTWKSEHGRGSKLEKRLLSHASFDAAAFPAFATALGNLVTAVGTSATVTPTDVARRLFRVLPGYELLPEEALFQPQLRDVGQMLDAFADEPALAIDDPVRVAATTARTALLAMIGSAINGKDRKRVQQGLSIEASLPDDWAGRRAAYLTWSATWDGLTNWTAALDALTAASNAVEPTVDSDLVDTTVTFSAADADVVRGLVALSVEDPGNPDRWTILGILAEGMQDPAQVMSYRWRGKYTTVSDGTTTLLAPLDAWITDMFHCVAGRIEWGATTYPAWLLVDPKGRIESVAVDVGGGNLEASLLDLWGWEFRAAITVIDSGTPTTEWTTGTIELGTKRRLKIKSVRAEPAVYRLHPMIYDVWGNLGSDAQVVDLRVVN